MRNALLLVAVCLSVMAYGQTDLGINTSPTWKECIGFYQNLAKDHSAAKLIEIGEDDNGSPIHMFIISDGTGFTPEEIRKAGQGVLLINNAIHPGEPCGVNSSMRLAKDLLESDQLMGLTANTTVCIIPMYNISGAQRRGCCSRANQLGPEEYGFRGSARNLDLNRDMIKMDTRNTEALVKVIREWDPDVFIDTHTTDGSDHQYDMQLLATQDDRLNPVLKKFMAETFKPALYNWMDMKEIPMCPYFWPKKDVPDNGMIGFDDSPRYTSGYTTLFNIFGFVSEAHMLKTFPERVEATYQLQIAILDVMNRHREEIRTARALANKALLQQVSFGFNHQLDRQDSLMIPFRAYKYHYYNSPVTGVETYRYFPEDPIDIEAPYFDTYVPQTEIRRPTAYIIPQQWRQVIERLKWNKVPMQVLIEDTVLSVTAYRIGETKTVEQPYEGHYLHQDIQVAEERLSLRFSAGDVLIKLGSQADRFVVETLEPQSADSYFAWGFFDSILQQKEWFSPYIFEDKAKQMLREDPLLQKQFEAWRSEDPEREKDGWGQLYWLYQRSAHYERTDRLYPVYRVE